MRVWQIDGENLIVASSERHMRTIFLDYHGESIRGHARRLLRLDELVEMCDTSDTNETVKIPASEIAEMCFGWFGAR